MNNAHFILIFGILHRFYNTLHNIPLILQLRKQIFIAALLNNFQKLRINQTFRCNQLKPGQPVMVILFFVYKKHKMTG